MHCTGPREAFAAALARLLAVEFVAWCKYFFCNALPPSYLAFVAEAFAAVLAHMKAFAAVLPQSKCEFV